MYKVSVIWPASTLTNSPLIGRELHGQAFTTNRKIVFREFLKVPAHFRPRSTSSPKSAPFSNQESRKKSGRYESASSMGQKRRSLPRLDRCHFAKKHFWVACLARIMRKKATNNSTTSAISSLTANDIRICRSGLQAVLKCETCCSAFRSEFNGRQRYSGKYQYHRG